MHSGGADLNFALQTQLRMFTKMHHTTFFIQGTNISIQHSLGAS